MLGSQLILILSTGFMHEVVKITWKVDVGLQ